MVAYRARLALAAAKAMSQNLRGNRVRPAKSNYTSLFHPHSFSETLLAWRIRNNGGDSWSHENLDFDSFL